MKKTDLRSMNPERALVRCINLTSTIWTGFDNDDILDLWAVFKDYIGQGYDDSKIDVRPEIAPVWGRCKDIIDREVGQ